MTIVHVREENPPTGDERLEWFLLTTLPVENADDAERILTWYGLRWRIEDRVLKSGCRIEELENRTAERLQCAAAMVVAWRIHLMARLGRELPDLPPEILFSDVELRVLAIFAKSQDAPKNLAEAVVANLGGYTQARPARRGVGVVRLCPARRYGFPSGASGLLAEFSKTLWGTGRARVGGNTVRPKHPGKGREGSLANIKQNTCNAEGDPPVPGESHRR